ncbi:hypothetical protein NFI96_007859 [Prochilodus magdalenae]|nr:hypothetical protein NFI96_007859 [Prochilodus magdalenae]
MDYVSGKGKNVTFALPLQRTVAIVSPELDLASAHSTPDRFPNLSGQYGAAPAQRHLTTEETEERSSSTFISTTTPTAASEVTEQCPDRILGNERRRTCPKKCQEDKDCANKRQCLCDGPCGLSCVAPGRTCPWPLPPGDHFSVVLLSPSPSFSALLEVRCHPGYAMANGLDAMIRRCQGDRQWSGDEPVCTDQKDPIRPENNVLAILARPCADGQQCSLGEQWGSPRSPAMPTVVVQCSPDGGLRNPGFLSDLADYYMP